MKEDDIDVVSSSTNITEDIKKIKKDLANQEKAICNHVVLFQETLNNLIKDKETSKKYQKRIDCLILTTQIFIVVVLILFAFVFLKVF